MNDDDRLLASAALDGAVTDEERARVEADPALRAEVDRLARVRDLVGTTPTPDPARRDSVLAAALAAAEEPAAPVAPVVPIGAARRRRWLAPVAAAAAVVAIGVGALVATQGGGDPGGEDAALESSTDGEAATDRLTAADAAAATVAPEGSEVAAAVPEAAGDTAERDAGGATELTEAAAATTAVAASESQFGLDEAPDGVVVLLSVDDLRAFAASATAPPAATTDAAGPRCSGGRWVGDARYAGGGEDRSVQVFVDGDRVLALDATTCEVVVEAHN